MKNWVSWRSRLATHNYDLPWVERNTNADMHIWRKKFFRGMGCVPTCPHARHCAYAE
jgi:hypothetical protein